MSTDSSRYLVVKSNELINARYQLTLAEMRLILKMITMITKDDEDFKEYDINIRDFVDEIETKAKNEYERARHITKELLKKVLEIPTETGYIQTAWIAGSRYQKRKGHVYVSFHPYLKPYLLKLKEKFTQYNLRHVLSLKSIYSIRIYELLKQYEKIGERTLELSHLKELLKVEDKYNLYADFKKRILNRAQSELKEYTDIRFKIEEIKKARKVDKIRFVITKNEKERCSQDTPQKTLPLKDDYLTDLINLLSPEHQDKKTIHTALDKAYQKHGFDYVARNIAYTNRNYKDNYRAYLNKALKEDWGLAMEEDEKREEKYREKQERQRQKEQEAFKHQEELKCQVKEYMKNLSFEELESLRQEVLSHLDEETKKNAQSFNTLEIIVKTGIEDIIKQRLNYGKKNR